MTASSADHHPTAGGRQEVTACASCGQLWPGAEGAAMRFCGACGAPLHLSDSLGATQAMDEELRHATVLFADLVGFTTYSEGRAADEVGEVVAVVLPKLVDVLRRFGGSAEKYLGDAVLSTFGLRRVDPSAARSAVRAGLELQRSMQSYRAETGHDLHLRVGVHSGEVMVRRVGDTWTIIGDTVNTAARLQIVADPDAVWISRSTYEEVRRHFEALPRPVQSLKGKALPVQPYEVRRERDRAGTMALSFKGRDEEFSLLTSQLESAIRERTAKVVVIRGAAGVGKTRLVAELDDRLEADSRLFRRDRIEYDRGDVAPAEGIAELLRHRFRLDAHSDAAATSAALRTASDVLDEQQLDFLTFVLGISSPGSRVATLDGETVWTGAYAALREWMQSQAATNAWVLMFEDAHLGDSETIAFLDWSLRVGWNTPLLVLVTVRDEVFGPDSAWHDPVLRWVESGHAAQIVLRELETGHLAEALADLTEIRVPRVVAERIAGHAEGHPLFALELVDFLVNSGDLYDVGAMNGRRLPASVREAMEARIERLGLEGKQAAKRAAFVGRRFTVEAVRRLWDGDERSLMRGLDALRRSEAVFEERIHGTEGSLELVFRHGRLQEVALARVPRQEGRQWHARLESWAHDRLAAGPDAAEQIGGEVIPLIARSRVAHGDAAGAADWFEALGLLHRRQHRSREAAQGFLTAAEHVAGVRRQLLQLRAADALSAWGEIGRALEVLETSEDDVDPEPCAAPGRLLTEGAAGPLDRWWELSPHVVSLARRLRHADLLSRSGNVARAAEQFEAVGAGLPLLSGRASRELRLVWGRDYVYFLVEVQGDLDRAIGVRDTVLSAVPDEGEKPLEVLVMEDLIAMRQGDLERAISTAEARLGRALAVGDPLEESIAWNTIGIVRNNQGDVTAALEAYERSLQLAQGLGHLRGEAITLHNIGLVHLDRAVFAAARDYTQRYLAQSRRIGNDMAESYGPIYLGVIAAADGDTDGGIALITRGRQAAEQHSWVRLAALADGMLGEVELLCGLETGDRARVAAATEFVLAGEAHWRSLDEVGELYAVGVAGILLGGDQAAAASFAARVAGIEVSGGTVQAWLSAAAAFVAGEHPAEALQWLRVRELRRPAGIVEILSAALATHA